MRGVFGLALVLGAIAVFWWAVAPQSFTQSVAALRTSLPTSAAGPTTRNGQAP